MLAGVSAVFTREHDVILLAEPFLLSSPEDREAWTQAHSERVQEAVLRNFLHSVRLFANKTLQAALDACRTAELGYRLTIESLPFVQADAVLLTCAPNAHLALANLLERGALFTVETVGRVTCRNIPSLH